MDASAKAGKGRKNSMERKNRTDEENLFVKTTAGESLTDIFVRAAAHRYHFEWKDQKKLRHVAAEVRAALEGREGFFYIFPKSGENFFGYKPEEGTLYAGVILTLGAELDRLQNGYSDRGDLEGAYMVEVISCELLRSAYLQCSEYLGKHTCYVPEEFMFFGEREELPLEKMPELLAYQKEQRVTCNEACCLEPKKSVVFLVKLKQPEKKEGTFEKKSISAIMCESCSKKECMYRKS